MLPHANTGLSSTAQAIHASVQECLVSGQWRGYQGPKLTALEHWFQHNFKTEHIRFSPSGTFGIELALRCLQIRPGAEVILSAYDYPGNFRCIEEIGAKPVLCVPDSTDGWCLTLEKLEQCVSPETKAVIVSHLHGQTAPMPEIMGWAKEHGLFVIEDACQAMGGAILTSESAPSPGFKTEPTHAPSKNTLLGSWGDVGVFSFGGSKLISAGRGGAVITRSALLAQRMRHFCERGNDAYAMSEMQAAIVLPQCEHLEKDHQARNLAARELSNALSQYSWIKPVAIQANSSQAFYKVGLRISQGILADTQRDHIVNLLVEHGIHAGEGFRGFAKRSQKRFRSPHSLEPVEELAGNTIVIHHDHLLQPDTGTNSVAQVLEAFEQISDQLALR